jgi:hypothetical protein
MSTEPISHQPNVDKPLSKLHILVSLSADHPVEILDLATFPSSAFDAISQPQPQVESVKQQIMDEFDPVGSQEEKAAKEAWESSESYPSPPPPPEDTKPKPPLAHAKNDSVAYEPPRFGSRYRLFHRW